MKYQRSFYFFRTIPIHLIQIQKSDGNYQSAVYVSLKVFDVLGNEITTLVNEEKPAGSNEIEFDARGLSNGIYFYTFRLENI